MRSMCFGCVSQHFFSSFSSIASLCCFSLLPLYFIRYALLRFHRQAVFSRLKKKVSSVIITLWLTFRRYLSQIFFCQAVLISAAVWESFSVVLDHRQQMTSFWVHCTLRLRIRTHTHTQFIMHPNGFVTITMNLTLNYRNFVRFFLVSLFFTFRSGAYIRWQL